MKRLVLVILAAVALAAPSGAQQNQNIAKGFNASATYDFTNVEAVSLFNGSITLTVPMGQAYAVGPRLSYNFGLAYTGNNWFLFENAWNAPDPNDSENTLEKTLYYYSVVDSGLVARYQAGLGWRLMLGELRGGTGEAIGTYIAPEGSYHSFFDKLHTTASDLNDVFAAENVYFTNDSSYLRLRQLFNGSSSYTGAEIDFPNGTIHKFDAQGQLVEMRDGMKDGQGNALNWVRFHYGTLVSGVRIVTVTDSLGRQHTLKFETMAGNAGIHRDNAGPYGDLGSSEEDPGAFEILTEVSVAAFGGQPATYVLSYVDVDSDTETLEAAPISRKWANRVADCSVPPTVHVPLLKSVTQPDGLGYQMTYDRGNLASFSDPELKTASATDIEAAATSPVSQVVIAAAGHGYGQNTTVSFSGGGASGDSHAQATVQVNTDGEVTAIEIDPLHRGSYTSAPTATIHGTGSGATAFAAVCSRVPGFSGNVTGLQLPTGGSIEWEYELWKFPEEVRAGDCKKGTNGECVSPRIMSEGVKTRLQRDAAPSTGGLGRVLSKRTYQSQLDGALPLSHHTLTTTVQDYAGFDAAGENGHVATTVLNFFSASTVDSEGPTNTSVGEYGLPFTRKADLQNSPLPLEMTCCLSTKTFAGTAAGTLLRSTYVTYEGDGTLEHGDLSNRRLKDEMVVFHDDRGLDNLLRYVKTARDGFTGLGHYSTVKQTSNIPSTPERVSTTHYIPFATGELDLDGLPLGLWLTSASNGTTVTESRKIVENGTIVTENGKTLKSEQWLDPVNPLLLKRSRTIRDVAGARGVNDVIVEYGYDANGNLASEKYYGGDTRPGDTGVGLEDLASVSLGTLDYSVVHERTAPSGDTWIEKSRYVEPLSAQTEILQTRDVTIDRNTGLVQLSRDAEGLATSFHYDAMSRQKSAEPPGRASSEITYPSAANRLLTVEQKSSVNNSVLTSAVYAFDGLGRLIQEKRRMPDGWSTIGHTYDGLGRKATVTVPEYTSAGDYTPNFSSRGFTEYSYDIFGRVKSVTEPDDSVKTIDYTGNRQQVRTVKVATDPAQATETAVQTTEQYDGFGRLIQVDEPSISGVTTPVTKYDYDTGDRLVEVKSGSQTRTFAYDAAGLLKEETHPETGALTAYSYDARGHVLSKTIGTTVDLGFDYDRAERLTAVKDNKTNTSLKVLTYDTYPGAATGFTRKGALVRQLRRNSFADGIHDVIDTFAFDPATGRPSKKVTAIASSGQATHGFEQIYQYTELDAPQNLNYPRCQTCGGGAGVEREIALQYQDGLLTGITGITAPLPGQAAGGPGISYGATGAVHQVQHAIANGDAGVLDTYTEDSSGMGRPGSIRFSNAPECDLIVEEPSDRTVLSGTDTTLTVEVVEGAQVTWYSGAQGNVVAGDEATLTLESITATAQYWAKVTMAGASCADRTRTITVSVCEPAVVQSPDVPSVHQVVPGQKVWLEVGATGTDLNFIFRATVNGSTTQLASGPTPGIEFSTATPGVYTITAVVAAFCGPPVAVDVATVHVTAPQADCLAAFGNPLNPLTVIPTVNSARWLEVSLLPVAATGAQYKFEWEESGKITASETNTNPLTKRIMQIGPQDKVVRVHASVTCNGISSPVITTETVVTVAGRCTPLSVKINPEAVTFDAGAATITLTANANRPDVTYQWYRGERGNTKRPVAGATGKQLAVAALADTYWVRIKSASGECRLSADSDTVPVGSTGCRPVRLLSEPQDLDITAGSSVTLSVDATGEPVPSVYEWHQSPASVLPAAESRTLVVRPIRTSRYWVDVTGCNETTSREALIRVTSCADINVQQQPADVTVAENTPVVLEMKATSIAPLRYQWYEGESSTMEDENGKKTILEGETGPILNLLPTASGKYWVRVFFDGEGKCAIDSRTVTVTFCDSPQLDTSMTDYVSRSAGMEVLLAAKAAGKGVTYEWFKGLPVESNRMVPTSWLANVAPERTTTYVVRATNSCTGPLQRIEEHSITVSVCPYIAAPPVANKNDVMAGTPVTLTIDAGNSERIEWFAVTAATGVNGVLVGTGSSITLPATETKSYFARLHSGICHSDSPQLEVKVCTPPTVQWGMNNPTKVEAGSHHTITAVSDSLVNFAFYEGESGDVAGSVLRYTSSASYSRYFDATMKLWVRVTNPVNGCYADTPTITVEVCVPVITAEPQPALLDKTTNPTASVPLSVTATPAGGTLTYQWYTGASGHTAAPVTGATASTYNASPSVDTSYWVRVTGCGVSRDSAAALVTVCKPPAISQQPGSRNLSSSGSVTLEVNSTGTERTFAWYEGVAGDTSKPLNKTTEVISVTANVTTDYWVRVSGRCGSVDSETAKVSIPPAITTQPVGDDVMPGSTVPLTAAATGAQLRYQWYIAPSTLITGATGATYTPPAPPVDTSYFCRVYSGNVWVDSAPALIDICTPPTLGWSSGIQTKAKVGQSQTLSVTGIDASTPHTKKWYQGDTGNTAVLLATSSTLPVAPNATTKYWARVTITATGCWADTPTLTIEVCVPTITSNPPATSMLDKTGNPSASVNLTVAADAVPQKTYQWYIGQPGVTSNPVVGQTSATFAASPAVDTTYWVRVTSACGATADSTAATVIVCKPPAISQQPDTQNLAGSGTVTLEVNATGTELTYAWYQGVSGDTSTPLNKTNDVISVPINVTTDYWVRVSGRCGSVNSATAKVSLPPAITTQPVGDDVMPGSTVPLTVAATGAQLRYQWYIAPSTLITGATSATYTPPAPPVDTTYFCRVYSGNVWVDSAPALIDICTPPTLGWSSGIQTKAKVGQSQTLSVTGIDASTPHAKKWYQGDTGNTAVLLATSSTLPVAPNATTKYWARVTITATGCWADTPTLTIEVCVPTITSNPSATSMLDKTGNPSASVNLTVAADAVPQKTYQWYIGQPGVTSNPVVGQTSNTFAASPAVDTTYWVRVTSACGATADSTAAMVIVCKPPAISQQPDTQNLAGSGTVTLEVNASGTELAYAWYQGVSGDTSTPLNKTTDVITVTANVTTDYWVRVSGRCGSVNSATAKVSIPPSITTQPAGGPLTSGTTRPLTVVAGGTQLTYLWYTVSGSTETPIPGATSASYTPPAMTADASYRCVVKSGNASTASNIATFTICQPRTLTQSSGTGVSGTEVTLSIVSPGAGETYEWYSGAKGNTSTPLGSGTTKKVSPTATSTYWARTKRSTCDADSDAITVRVCYPAITTQPQGTTVGVNGQHTLTVAATGTGPLTYQWYKGAVGDTTQPLTGTAATTASYPTGPLTATTTYWVRVSSPVATGCAGSWTNSVAATVTVCTAPSISAHPAARNIQGSTSTALSVTATGDGLTYQWYQGAAGVTTTPVGTNSNNFSPSPSATTYYWVRVTGNCGTVDSTAALVSVYPVITVQPVDTAICNAGESASFSVTASGADSYEWQRHDAGGWTTVGTSSNQLTIPVAAAPIDFRVYARSGNASTASNTVTVSMNPKPGVSSVSKTFLYTGTYRLSVTTTDSPEDLIFAWYQGALGNMTTKIGSNYYVTVTPAAPVSYWVRVTNPATGCSTDKATSF